MENENSRLKEFRLYLKIQQGEFSAKLGLKQGSYSDIERGRNAVSYPVIKKAMEEFNLNPNWLITGEGNMFYSPGDKKTVSKEKPNNDFTIKDNIVLVEAKAAAGYLQGLRQEENFINTMPTFRIPGFYGNSFRAFEVKGNSMVPTLYGKDIVVCSRVENIANVKSERIYVIVLTDGSIVVKRLRKRNQCFDAVSDNDEEYPFFTIEYEDIFELWEVEARITGNLEDRKPSNLKFSELEERLMKIELLLKK